MLAPAGRFPLAGHSWGGESASPRSSRDGWPRTLSPTPAGRRPGVPHSRVPQTSFRCFLAGFLMAESLWAGPSPPGGRPGERGQEGGMVVDKWGKVGRCGANVRELVD